MKAAAAAAAASGEVFEESSGGMRCIPRSLCNRYLPKMRSSGVALLLSAYPGTRNRRRKLKAYSGIYGPVGVAGVCGMAAKGEAAGDAPASGAAAGGGGNVCLVRALQTKVVHDCYSLEEMQTLFADHAVDLNDSDGGEDMTPTHSFG